MDENVTKEGEQRFKIFRAGEARDYGAHDLQRVDDMTPAIAAGLAHYVSNAEDTHGQIVELLYGAPGFSLTKVWFKSFYPLPLHSHGSDCLYYILAGSLRFGTEELKAGDGFFVGADVPYTYTAGPEGVEVLEFRDTDQLNIRFMSRGARFWEKAGETIQSRREIWRHERPPSRAASPED